MMSDHDEAVLRTEPCSVAAVRRVAAMLDLDPDGVTEGAPLPRGWQFILLGADTRRGVLRADGFPGLGVPMPDLGLPRLLLGGRSVSYLAPIAIGATVTRSSTIKSLTQKDTDSGPMAVVTINHTLHTQADAGPAIVESQTYLLLPPREGAFDDSAVPPPPSSLSFAHTKTMTPDATLLFQYSALGFNSHKIHLDRTYTREVEGFPELLVNGGLATLLLTEFLRTGLNVVPKAFKTRHLLPLFCGRPMTLAAERHGAGWRLQAFDDKGRPAVDMAVEV